MSRDAFRVLIVLVMLVIPAFSEPIISQDEESTETMRFDSRNSADSYSLKDGCLTIRSRRGIGEVTLLLDPTAHHTLALSPRWVRQVIAHSTRGVRG